MLCRVGRDEDSALIQRLRDTPEGPSISGAEQGLHLCLRLPSHADDKALAQRLAQQGLTVRPLSAYCLARNDLKGLVIGYGYAPLTDIQRCGPVLSAAVKSLMST